MLRKIIIRASFILLTTIILNGCVVYKNNKIPVVTNSDLNELKIKSSKKRKLFISVDFGSDNIAKDLIPFYSLKHAINEGKKRTIQNLISDTNCCVFTTDRDSADVVAYITIFPKEKPKGLALLFQTISGVTLTVIPSWYTEEIRVSAKIIKKGYEEKEYDLNDSVTTINWIPLILAVKYARKPWNVATEVRNNIYNNLIANMVRDGFLD